MRKPFAENWAYAYFLVSTALAVGGIVFALYHVIFGAAPDQSIAHERHQSRHRFHLLAVVSGPGLFSILLFLTNLNPIYSASIGVLGGFVAALYCRPDLWLKMVSSGFLFFVVCLAVFSLFNLSFPGYVLAVWNLKAVSGILIWGVLLEELMFAFTFGLYWSSVYEHL